MDDRTLKYKIIAAFAAVYFFWGSTFIAIRFAVESIPPFLMASSRFLVAGAILYLFARFKGATVPALKQWLPAFAMGALLLVFGNGSVVIAEKTVPSGVVSLLIAMVPIYFAILEWIKPGGKAPNFKTSIGLIIGTIGLLLLIGPHKIMSGSSDIDLKGVFIVLGGSLAWSIGSLLSKTTRISENPTMGLAMQTLAAGIMMFVLSCGFGEIASMQFTAVSVKSLVSLLYLIVFGSLVGFTSYVWLLQTVSPTLVATYAYVNPVIAVLLGWLLAGEKVTADTMLAGSVILVAVWLITQSKRAVVSSEKIQLTEEVSNISQGDQILEPNDSKIVATK
ncbi:MAG TPA: EamA family transporter [Candidatus Melainabacteria bacterium]|nr:EamA family transporter [Candidatus Melainabacteria bacterium]